MDYTPVQAASDAYDKVCFKRVSDKIKIKAREEFHRQIQIYYEGLALEHAEKLVQKYVDRAFAEYEKKQRGF